MSDNGTNFVGTSKELKELSKFLKSQETVRVSFYVSERIQWKFIPERTPHFSGIWEAVVKSTKHHLRKAFGEQKFTFEELTQTIDRQRSLSINVVDTFSTIAVEPTTVSLSVKPQRYREISLRTPVRVPNLPEEISTVRLSHEFVEYTCLVPARDFERYLSELGDMTIEIPFADLRDDWPYFIPQPEFPEAVQLIRREPLELTYTIVSR